MTERRLCVRTAYPNDFGRGIARLDPDTLLGLRLSPGQFIEIEGTDTTTAKVWRAARQDWKTDTIHVDRFTRRNAGVEIDDRVSVRKAEAIAADRVVIALAESERDAEDQFGADAAAPLKRQLIGRPLIESDVVPVLSVKNHPFVYPSNRLFSMKTVDTGHGEVVVVTQDTDVILAESEKA